MIRMFCVEEGAGGSNRNWYNVSETNHRKAIMRYCREYFYVHDADSGGDSDYYFGIKDSDGSTHYYHVYHDWTITREPEWDISNTFDITETTETIAHSKGVTSDRDWLIL
jgi:hypothetical protein